ncbi:hypothetical protein APHWI1_1346 [Anaplasma phagocytophilum str. ApWI1]|uniref:Uncharacterized protein n=5 Tax=Anaplasma phagocytophilum TaxID=948 RepID=A0A0F3NI24_ANAPH|nr:hypothetical protein APHMUC_1616 [Anaplasma phagocytophilum str. ApMUC09]KJV67660.1 hypothetical protein APHNP_1468 [Anaplasma phagocytophilum str. ApNP]KJV83597.1 hypothetical protein APHHGE2_0568 [Anaplasma phagocytophilum str. HGE2]KJV84986.1 hypothetical protein APHWI1_1346 [Anaplasma phagocytophilum str. ApWI1]KJV87928.1 hypothetical protein APHNYW_0297 [Anaplasma phagocytophilum str. ApNYW]KJV99377.1 hypothetical protein OTSANNIE_0542 [Anaplasma phagocytophilum str. Annie]
MYLEYFSLFKMCHYLLSCAGFVFLNQHSVIGFSRVRDLLLHCEKSSRNFV